MFFSLFFNFTRTNKKTKQKHHMCIPRAHWSGANTTYIKGKTKPKTL